VAVDSRLRGNERKRCSGVDLVQVHAGDPLFSGFATGSRYSIHSPPTKHEVSDHHGRALSPTTVMTVMFSNMVHDRARLGFRAIHKMDNIRFLSGVIWGNA